VLVGNRNQRLVVPHAFMKTDVADSLLTERGAGQTRCCFAVSQPVAKGAVIRATQ
jgi:hypothetical protein